MAYQADGTGSGALLDELAAYVYRYPHHKYSSLDADAAGEFLVFCHAKIRRLVDRFRYTGKPFERYFNSVLSWQLKTFLRRRKDAEIAWRAAMWSPLWEPDLAPPGVVHAIEPARAERAGEGIGESSAPPRCGSVSGSAVAGEGGGTAPTLRLPADTTSRRLLFAVLKCSHLLSERQLQEAARGLRCNPQRLALLVAELARRRAQAHQRFHRLSAKRNRAYTLAQLWAANAHVELDPQRRAYLEGRVHRYRRTAATAQRDIAKVRRAATNRDIGEVLGVPKGTVDTGLFWLQRRNTTLYARGDAARARQQQPAQGHRNSSPAAGGRPADAC